MTKEKESVAKMLCHWICRNGIFNYITQLANVGNRPKAGVMDDILAAFVMGEKKDDFAARIGEQSLKEEGQAIQRCKKGRDSNAVLLIWVRTGRGVAVNYGACGYTRCHDLESGEKGR